MIHIGIEAERFWAKVDKSGDCWLWTAGCDSSGYGSFKSGGVVVSAHRWAWEQVNGPIPQGLCVLHSCDVRRCVNTAHHFTGTRIDNNSDRDAKCRGAIGERNGRSKLTAEKVLELRRLHREGSLPPDLARNFGVTTPVIHNIIAKRIWRSV